MQAGYLTLKPAENWKLVKSQPGLLAKKRAAWQAPGYAPRGPPRHQLCGVGALALLASALAPGSVSINGGYPPPHPDPKIVPASEAQPEGGSVREAGGDARPFGDTRDGRAPAGVIPPGDRETISH